MTIYDLKPKFQNILRPLVKSIWKLGITPNQITASTCLLSVAVGLWLLCSKNEMFFILPVFFFIRMALNAIDGMLAKEHNLKSPIGAILNEVTDVVSDGFLYYAFSRFDFINTHLLMFVIFFSAISEITGLAVLLNGSTRQYAGPMGKSDRAFVFSVLAILISCHLTSAFVYNGILTLIALLLVKTILNRAKKGM
ncbi:MAG: CDP-alcohol phosphatidyltransferase family protein [Bacteriovorax sp.]|nr:CDP-alcohol phosphatidyltransferase family protein [Bacteriovorax sp.]